MATTPNWSIVYPVVGTTMTPLANHFANLANSVDTALETVEGLVTSQNRQFKGLAADKASVTGMVLGDTYQETDGSKLIWKYDGTGWKVQGIASLPPYNSATVAFTGVPFMRGGIASGTTSSGGVLSHSFASAFTTGCAGVLLMPHQNSGYSGDSQPVIVQGSVSASGFQTFWGGAASTSVTVPYIAFGY